MIVDWDGVIRMDPSAPHAIQQLFDLKDRFEIGVARGTDPDRHESVNKIARLLAASDPREKS
ncbi:MAG: hypothetical protein WCB12_18505 [Bryobacteraceae bacterium]